MPKASCTSPRSPLRWRGTGERSEQRDRSGLGYRPEQAMDGWSKVFAFFGKHLAK
jgi:dienelactone hydrolase